jgi:ribosomal protein S18 acetylase RimI-like enzyme
VELTGKPFTVADAGRAEALLLACRGHACARRYPTLWRLRLLIDSRLWEPERDARLWEDDAGEVIGLAMLTRRQKDSPAMGLDRVLLPDAFHEVRSAQIGWALSRCREFGKVTGETVMLGALPLEWDEPADIALLEQSGFERYPDAHNVYMACALADPPAVLAPPDGFILRDLDTGEIEAYHAMYGFAPVSETHRRELISHPEYRHIVVQATDGRLAGFVECSISREEWARSGKRIGWVDYVETVKEFQGLGLGKALLAAGLDHLKYLGASEARLVTTSQNDAALRLYASMGLAVVDEEPVFIQSITADSPV